MSEELEDKYVVVLVDTIEKRLGVIHSESNLGVKKPPSIHKVHKSLRRGNDRYDPKLISIGPLHHHKPELKRMEDLKFQYLLSLINRNPQTNKVKTYVDALRRRLQEAREQYSIKIELTDEKFVELLLLDGCFIVEFFIKRALGAVGSPWKDTKWSLPMLWDDLLLLENQVPFFVLELIYNNSSIRYPNDVELNILDLAFKYINKVGVSDLLGTNNYKDKVTDLLGTKEIHHLLHLHQICLLRYLQPESESTVLNRWIDKKSLSEGMVACFLYLPSLVLMCKLPKHRFGRKVNTQVPRMVPCARHLEQAGVRFRKKDDKCMLNVSFTEDGTLEMPLLKVKQSTKGQFANLIAFEQCCPSAGNQFTAYMMFLDYIIDTPEDVAILRKAKIIESKLGSDEEVAMLFNGICKGAAFNYDKHYLVEVFRKLNSHFESHGRRAELVKTYFDDPRKTVSVFAASTLLVLTFMQTYFTMMSYWK